MCIYEGSRVFRYCHHRNLYLLQLLNERVASKKITMLFNGPSFSCYLFFFFYFPLVYYSWKMAVSRDCRFSLHFSDLTEIPSRLSRSQRNEKDGWISNCLNYYTLSDCDFRPIYFTSAICIVYVECFQINPFTQGHPKRLLIDIIPWRTYVITYKRNEK